MTDDERRCASCVPLAEFVGKLPRGFAIYSCTRCRARIVVSSLTLKSVDVDRLFCDNCMAVMMKAMRQAGHQYELVRAPGTLSLSSPMQRAIDIGAQKENPDPFFRNLRELEDWELKDGD